MERVSVILPVWNAESTISAAVESVLLQNHGDLELIVVDDGSTDRTPDYLSAVRDDRLRVVQMQHGGIVRALNAGIDAATSSLIARMDADDVSLPGRISAQASFLASKPELGLVGCLVEFGGDRDAQAGYARYVDWTNAQTRHDQIALARFIESPFAHPSIMFRRDLLDRFGGYRDGPFPEDYELVLRWLDAGVLMAKVPEVLLRWNDPPGRLSRTEERYSIDAFYRTKARYLAQWLARHNPLHPDVVIWGAGRTTRQRAYMLREHGIRIAGYVDIDPRKTGSPLDGVPRYHHEKMPGPEDIFVLTYVAKPGAREANRQLLIDRAFVEGRNFIQCA